MLRHIVVKTKKYVNLGICIPTPRLTVADHDVMLQGLLNQRKKPAKLHWTQGWRRLNKKGKTEEVRPMGNKRTLTVRERAAYFHPSHEGASSSMSRRIPFLMVVYGCDIGGVLPRCQFVRPTASYPTLFAAS
jgi:hypothetical protein